MDTVTPDSAQISLFSEMELPPVPSSTPRVDKVAPVPKAAAEDDQDDEPPKRQLTAQEIALRELTERNARARMKRRAAANAWAKGKPAGARIRGRWENAYD